jgi:xanthine dehydrogenase YagR molybdenum-binding subunit
MTWLSGGSAPRIEAELKVTGAARYEGETLMSGLHHAALVTAPVASGRLRRIDAGRALAQAGVAAVLSHENAPRLAPGDDYLRLLQEPVVHFAGQPVALVVAETRAQAHRAAELVELVFDPAPASSLDPAHARPFAPKTAGRTETDSRRGDPERAIAGADVVIARRYTTPVHNHHPIEPHAVIAAWDGNRVTVHTTSQAVFAFRVLVARAFQVPLDRVRIVSRFLGGGFGAKGSAWVPGLIAGVAAARAVGRPVRLELTRAQMFTLVGRRQETVQHVCIGANREGRLAAIAHDSLAVTSTYGEYADPVGTPARVLYACEHVATSHRLIRRSVPKPNAMRAPGEAPGSFALESAMDELAYELRLDPVELRLRNFAGRDQHRDLPWSSNGLRECYRVAAEAFGWAARPSAIGALRDGRSRIGWGMASVCYPVYRTMSEASVKLTPDGDLQVRCGTQDIGTGTYTVLAQIAAQIVGIPLAHTTVELGDTDLPEGPPSAGSMATASFAPAVEAAATELRRRLVDLAAGDPASSLFRLPAHTLVLDDGVIRTRSGERGEPVSQLLVRSAPRGLETSARSTPDENANVSSFGYGAVFAEVKVDSDLGEVGVARLTAAYAAGRILNPLLARSQYIGGLVGGIGMALHEATITDERLGRVLGTSLSDYLIPVHADMPVFDVHIVDEDDSHLAGGIKGIGMLGTVGVAAAIANAVFHATGIRVRDLPIRPERCLLPDS